MRAYLYDNLDTDCREPHELSPSVPVSVEELAASGVLYWKLKGENFEEQIDRICKERNYKNRDQVCCSLLPSFLGIFFFFLQASCFTAQSTKTPIILDHRLEGGSWCRIRG